jgi:hypothetical protein
MAPEPHPRNDGRVDLSTLQTFSPSDTRLANVPEQAVEKVFRSSRGITFLEDDDDNEIQGILEIVRVTVHGALKEDARLKGQLAEMEEFFGNATRKGG